MLARSWLGWLPKSVLHTSPHAMRCGRPQCAKSWLSPGTGSHAFPQPRPTALGTSSKQGARDATASRELTTRIDATASPVPHVSLAASGNIKMASHSPAPLASELRVALG